MNQKQRDFLVETIEKNASAKISELKDEQKRLEKPRIYSYIIEAIGSGKAELNELSFITAGTRDAALSRNAWRTDEDEVMEKWLKLIYKQPKEYTEKMVQYQENYNRLSIQINDLTAKRDTLIMRVKLAPDKRLDALISEIDDMGDISMIDNTLVLIAKSEQKLLS